MYVCMYVAIRRPHVQSSYNYCMTHRACIGIHMHGTHGRIKCSMNDNGMVMTARPHPLEVHLCDEKQ